MLPKHIHRWPFADHAGGLSPFADHAGKHLLIRTHSGKLSLRLSGSPTEVAILSLAPVSLLGLVLGTQEEAQWAYPFCTSSCVHPTPHGLRRDYNPLLRVFLPVVVALPLHPTLLPFRFTITSPTTPCKLQSPVCSNTFQAGWVRFVLLHCH